MRLMPCFLSALALAGCTCGSPDARGLQPDEVLVQISATGRNETRPDEARFTAGVDTIAATAAAASAQNAAAMNKVTAALQAIGVKREDLQTRSLQLSRIDYGANRGRFQAHNIVEVRVRKVDAAGAAVAAATQAGANVLSGPDLAISDREAAGRSAYAAAYRAARSRAEAYAEAAGLKVARVIAIRDSGEGGDRRRFEGGIIADAAAETQSVAPPPIEAGRTTSEARVSVDFALAPK